MVKGPSWLSVTPEPERELPDAVAALSCGCAPPADRVRRERERVERLLLHGSQRQWLAYLSGVVDLIERNGDSEDAYVAHARERARAVIANHHNLLLALPGRAGEQTAADRARLAASNHTQITK